MTAVRQPDLAAGEDSRAEPSPVMVRPADDSDAQAWDAYVTSAPDGSFFHRYGWRQVLERAAGHKTHFLIAESGGRVTGVLPLAHVRSRLFSNALIAMPFCVYGGVVAADDASRDALEAAACERAKQLGVDYLEMRNRTPVRDDWPRKDLYVTFRKEMDPDPDANMKAVPRKQRAMIRKGIKAGLESEADSGTARFYDCYSQSVRNLGTPVMGRRYFDTLMNVFGDDCRILTVTKDGEAVASVMNFYFRDEVLPYYGGGTHAARRLYANDFMYWEVMRQSVEAGLRVFDYGRSKIGTGSYRFKKHWGFEPEALAYEYFLVKAPAMPNLSPTNPKYKLFIDTWKRLPVGLTRVIGPFLARSLG